MRPGLGRQIAGETGVVADLDALADRGEARAAIEPQRLRAVELAGVDVEPGDGPGKGPLDGEIHQGAADALADQRRGEAEIGQFAALSVAAVEFEQAFGTVPRWKLWRVRRARGSRNSSNFYATSILQIDVAYVLKILLGNGSTYLLAFARCP